MKTGAYSCYYLDDQVRLWVMKPQAMGDAVSYERVTKCTIPLNYNSDKLRGVIEFFWMVQVNKLVGILCWIIFVLLLLLLL